MNCIVCYEQYDSDERKPVGWPCGHTLCRKCVSSLVTNSCPDCRQEVPCLAQLPTNYTVLRVVEEMRSLEARGSGPQTLRSNSVRLMRDLNASFRRPHTPSTPQPAQSRTIPALVAQLQSPHTPEQQEAALQALRQATAPPAGPAEAPQGDAKASDSEAGATPVQDAGCDEAVSAGAIPALIAILRAAASNSNASSTDTSSSSSSMQEQQVQALAAEVLGCIMLDSVARQRAAVEAGLVPVAARLLGHPFPGNTKLPLPVVLLAICDSSYAADVKAAVGQAAAVHMMQSSDPELQTAGLQLLGHILTNPQEQEQGQQQEQAGLAGADIGVDSAVVGLLGSIDEDVQAGAVTLLQSLAGESQRVAALLDAQVVPRLVRMVHTPRLSEGVVRTLRRIASNSSREVSTLQGHAANPQAAVDELCREGALRAVVQLLRSDQGGSSTETVQHAVHLLFTCSCASLSAARVIYRAGGCQVLQGLLGHADESIRDTAAATLRHIQATR